MLQLEFLENIKKWRAEIPPIKGTIMYQFQQKLKLLKEKLKKWNKDSFRNIFQAKKELDIKIQEVQQRGIHNSFSEEIQNKEKLLI